MDMEKGNNQMYASCLLYFDPVYREKSIQKPEPLPLNQVPQFTAHMDPRAPYKGCRAVKTDHDGNVIVSIHEPDAAEVFLAGKGCTFMDGPYRMQKNEKGYFQYVLKDLRPGLYLYGFLVDGVEKINTEAPVTYGCSTLVNILEIPDPEDDSFSLQRVPHGQLRFEHIWSEICNRYRGCWVYTPPGYEESGQKRYPVLYIQHGGGENEAAWFFTARINYLADNYIAGKKMREMIIVCSDGFVPHEISEDTYVNESFEEEFVKEIVPAIDSRYRTIADRLGRAMAGLSMGGGQARFIVHSNPDLFAYLGQFSSGAGFEVKSDTGYYGNPIDFSSLFCSPEHYNNLMKLTFISCGTEDPRHGYTMEQCRRLADQGYHVEYHPYQGNHEWEPWRRSVCDFLPRLFQED